MPLLTPAEEIRTFPSRSCVSLKEIKHEENLAQCPVQGKDLANRPAPLVSHRDPPQLFSAVITSTLISRPHQPPSSSSSTILILPAPPPSAPSTSSVVLLNHLPPHLYFTSLSFLRASLVAQLVKTPPAMWETWV